MTLKEFLKSKTFKVNALAALGITIFLIIVTMLFLRIYTNHGGSVDIPDLRGKTTSEVAEMLKRKDLRFQIRDSVYSRDARPGTVLDQFPKAGMKVKKYGKTPSRLPNRMKKNSVNTSGKYFRPS